MLIPGGLGASEYAGYGGQRGWFWLQMVSARRAAWSGEFVRADDLRPHDGRGGAESALGRLGRVLSIRWPKRITSC